MLNKISGITLQGNKDRILLTRVEDTYILSILTENELKEVSELIVTLTKEELDELRTLSYRIDS